MKLEESIKYNKLLDSYGALLTEHQLKIMQEYYFDDLSLGEIADNHEVSRNAIFTLIKKCEVILNDYESKLHLVEKKEKIADVLDEIEDKNKVKKIKELLGK